MGWGWDDGWQGGRSLLPFSLLLSLLLLLLPHLGVACSRLSSPLATPRRREEEEEGKRGREEGGRARVWVWVWVWDEEARR